MKQWSVTHGVASVEVPASNWLVALGRGLDELGHAGRLERLACEVLPNGTVIARDVTSGSGYVVQAVDADPDAPGRDDDDDVIAVEGEAEEPSIAEASTRARACELALQEALGIVAAESGAVLLAERGQLCFVSVDGPNSAELRGQRLPLGRGIAGFAMLQRRTIVLDDARSDPRHATDIDALTGYVTRQIAVVPVGGTVDDALGVIEVMNLADGERFQPEHLVALERVARRLAERLTL